jgi:hypothetical protein
VDSEPFTKYRVSDYYQVCARVRVCVCNRVYARERVRVGGEKGRGGGERERAAGGVCAREGEGGRYTYSYTEGRERTRRAECTFQ